MIKRISQILIILLLAFFPTGELLRIRIYESVNIIPQDIIVFALFLLVILKFLSGKIKPKLAGFFKFQLLFICIGAISLIINKILNPEYNFSVSLMYAFRYFMYLCILFYPILVGNKFNINKLLTISGGVIVAVGIPQFFFYNNLRNLFYLGWDDHLYRLFSTFLDPNFLGLFYVLYLGFLITKINEKGLNRAYFEIILSIFTLISIYLTYSRSALVALFVFVISMFIQLKKTKYLLITIPLLVILILAFSDFGTEGLNPLRTASSRDRVRSVGEVTAIIQDNLIYGVGFNSFRYAQIKYGLRGKEGAALSNADAGTDNSLLFVIATTGLLGFSVFIFGYYKIFSSLIQEKTFESKTYLALLLALLAGGFFINSLFYIPILTWMLLTLAFRRVKGNS